MVTGELAPGMAPVHTSPFVSDISRYMPEKTREYGNWDAKKTCKKLTILSRALDVIAVYAI